MFSQPPGFIVVSKDFWNSFQLMVDDYNLRDEFKAIAADRTAMYVSKSNLCLLGENEGVACGDGKIWRIDV